MNPRNPDQAMGRSRHNKLVFFDGDGTALKGSLVQVRLCNNPKLPLKLMQASSGN